MRFPDPLTRAEKRKLTGLRAKLLEWAKTNGRDFPWRSSSASTYERVVVEVLLQRTTASAVGNFYRSFIDSFPGWDELAAAEPVELEQFLKPLGLWRRRASSLLGLARYAVSVSGEFPRGSSAHAEIPAVGQYVSNAISMFQHGARTPLLDVNMARLVERFVRPRKLADIRYDPWLQEAAHWLVQGEAPEQINWAVLDFSALVCRARAPLCHSCPVNRHCAYFRGKMAEA